MFETKKGLYGIMEKRFYGIAELGIYVIAYCFYEKNIEKITKRT